jgi:uncharacterized membrane protein
MNVIKPLLVMLLALLVLDALWILVFMQGFYEREIGELLKTDPNLVAAISFYIAYPLGAFWLAVVPALKLQSIKMALVNGGVLGGVAYGTFAITNLSIIEGWSISLTVTDLVWGIFVTAIVSVCGYMAGR